MDAPEDHIHAASQTYFNRWAKHYDRSPPQLWFRRNYRFMAETVNPPPDAHVLDIGCGTGQMAVRLAVRVPDGHVLGVDPAEEMLRVANTKAGDNLSFRVGAGDALPVDDHSYDYVVSTISFHHWTRPAESLAEIARVLKPNGHLFILDFCRDHPLMKVNDWLGKRFQRSHYGIASSRDMRAWCEAAGFGDVTIARPRFLLMLVHGVAPAA